MSESETTTEEDENDISNIGEEEGEDDDHTSSDDENYTSTMSANNSHVQNGDRNADVLRWDRSRSRRYNLEMLREHEQRRCNEIVSRLVEAHSRQLNDGSTSSSDDEDNRVSLPNSSPDCRGIYAAIESKWRSANAQPSSPSTTGRQHLTSSSLTRDKSFTRKTTGVMAATRFQTVKKFQLKK
ncbi:hypothetical protein CHUAL_005843 [Chamberlinius hualienensis]